MNVLIDEMLSHRLANYFPDTYRVRAVNRLEWRGRRNGDLLRLASQGSYELLVTVDRDMHSQQSARTLPFPVIVLHPLSQGTKSAGSLIASRVVPLLGRSLRVGFYDVWHDGRITFRQPADDRVEVIAPPEDGDDRG